MIFEARCDPGNVLTSLCSTALELLGVSEQTKDTPILKKASLSVSQKMLEVSARSVIPPKVEIRKPATGNKNPDTEIKGAKFNNMNKWNWVSSEFFSTKNKLSGPVVFLIERNLRLFQTADVGEEYAKAPVDSLETLGIEFNITSGQEKYEVIDINLRKGLQYKLYTDDGLLDTIVLAADVIHVNKATDDETSSLAAVVGSIDGDFFNYLGSMRPNDIDFEPIKDIGDMVVERLRAWFEHSMIKGKHRLPKRILYYRDGVGDSQYYEIRKSELIGIRNAYLKLHTEYTQAGSLPLSTPPTLAITAIIVTKRHHTRFFPKSTSSKQNCPPGTVVDSGVTSPYHFDFYLQSHHTLAGTARPTYYVVLENGIDLTPRQLQGFTNLLYYTFVRATLPVGYVPPTYYTDRLCDRARCYIRDAHAALKKENKEQVKAAKK
ncbi:hypothetical protein P3342_007121 [Pyrenophora teres f. teres]|nr:hypothetical protein P3342_007121 [Pyrenophora teres f. teres]